MVTSLSTPDTARSTRNDPGAPWRRLGLVAAVVLPLAGYLIFFAYPVVSLLGRGLSGPHGFDPGAAVGQLLRPRFARILAFTVGQALASAALSLGFGIPGAYLLYRCRFRGSAVLRALVFVPFVLPTVVVGLAFRSLLADDAPLGFLGLDGTLISVLLAHLFVNYTVVVRMVGASWSALDDRAEQAAQSLGASRWKAFRTVTLPALGPAIAGAGVLVFLFCATSFGIVLVLGNGQLRTLETEIYLQTTSVLDLRTAAVLSVAQICLVAVAVTASAWFRKRTEATLSLASPGHVQHRLRRSDLPAVAVSLLMAALLVLPLGTLVVRSLRTPDGWGLSNYIALGTSGTRGLLLGTGWNALGHSLTAALRAAALALLVGVLLSLVLARRPRRTVQRRLIATLDGMFLLPLGVSAATVGFGFLIALDEPPLNLRTSPWLIPIAQALVATPIVLRLLLPPLRGLDERLRSAAALLGSSPGRVWWTVDVPLIARAFGAAAGCAFAIALGEFGATSFLSRPESVTLPVLIGRLASRPGPGNGGMAFAAAVLLAGLCGAVVLLVDLLLGRVLREAPGTPLAGLA
jgi:thiamine transport system permease protein